MVIMLNRTAKYLLINNLGVQTWFTTCLLGIWISHFALKLSPSNNWGAYLVETNNPIFINKLDPIPPVAEASLDSVSIRVPLKQLVISDQNPFFHSLPIVLRSASALFFSEKGDWILALKFFCKK